MLIKLKHAEKMSLRQYFMDLLLKNTKGRIFGYSQKNKSSMSFVENSKKKLFDEEDDDVVTRNPHDYFL